MQNYLHDIFKALTNSRSITMSYCKHSDYAEFSKVLSRAKNIVALTGAGISAESGIPVFRGPGGWWRTHRSTDLDTPQAFQANPSLVWEFYQYRREVAFNAQPNKAHIALAKYEELCRSSNRIFTVITQNIDGLHIRAGSQNVVELHGSLRKVICTKCRKVEINEDNPICESLRGKGDPNLKDSNSEMIPVSDLPKCKSCGSLVRPYIVWFSENLDPYVMNRAHQLIDTCDFCLVIGTSSVVYPAAMFAPLVVKRGQPVAEFNINEEPTRNLFIFYFSGPSGTTLPKALGIEDL